MDGGNARRPGGPRRGTFSEEAAADLQLILAGRRYANCLRRRIGEPIPSGLSNGFGGFVASGLLAVYADHEEIDTDLIAINPGELATAVSQAAG